MLEKFNPDRIIFLDIETVPQYSASDQLSEPFASLWEKKAGQLVSRTDRLSPDSVTDPALLYERAGIYAEFGKIVCISTGIYRGGHLRLRSFSGHQERELLTDFTRMLIKAGEAGFSYLCAHNGKEFDFPYLIRRMLILGLEVPAILDLSDKKPWEVPHLDTIDLWKFGDYKSYTSLELLAAVFGIPTPKDDIRGSDVARVYWQEDDLPRIVSYCQKDVVTIVNLFMRFRGLPIVGEEKVQIVGPPA